MRIKNNLIIGVVLGFLLLGIDLLGKHLFTSVINSGAVFGIGELNSVMVFLHLIALVSLCYWLFVVRSRIDLVTIILTIVMISSFSNLIDRFVYFGVRDYLLAFGFWFNIADLSVTLGIIALVIIDLYTNGQGRKGK